jgi:hypothetical protein
MAVVEVHLILFTGNRTIKPVLISLHNVQLWTKVDRPIQVYI